MLQGVLGVDKTVRMPSVEDKIFRTVASLADEQAKAKGFDPSLEQTLRAVQEQVSRAPLQVSITSVAGDKKQLRMTRQIFDAIVVGRLGDRNLPALLNATKRGDLSLLSQVAQSLYQDIEKGAGSLMARSINCSASAPVALRKQATREGPSSLFGEPFDNLMQTESFCRGLGFTSLPPKQPAVRTEIPTLLISGSLDDRTPPAYAEYVRRGFRHGEHLIVKYGGHELLTEPKVQDLVSAFFQDQPRPAALELEKPEFGTIEEAKRPPRRPR